MPFCRFRRRPSRATALLFLALPALLLSACERRPAASRADSVATPVSAAAESAARRRVASGWSNAAGPVLLIQGPAREEAIALYPTADDRDVVAQFGSACVGESA